MYALGKPYPLRERCREILLKIAREEVGANIDTEVLQELLYVYSSRGEREKALTVVEEMLILFPNPYSIKREEVEKAKDLMQKYNALTARDAIHCAVAMNYKLEGMISTDRDLESIKEISLFKP
jgi:hypothetical protein